MHYDVERASYILDREALVANLTLIKKFRETVGLDLIMALKACALWHIFPLAKTYLSGATASSLNEAKLINEHMGCKAHTYAPAYLPDEINEIVSLSSHIVFNSLSEYRRYVDEAAKAGVSIGLRVNPGWSDVATDKYNPSIPGSRLGINNLSELPPMVDGLHVHVLCESNADSLEKVIDSIEKRFGHLLSQLKWLNLGGGHLITHKNYDVSKASKLLQGLKEKYDIQLILEPGSAIFWETGVLVSHALDIVENEGIKTLMLDVSFTAHMPDTLEMPYMPNVRGAENSEKGDHIYQLGGTTCLAGDFIGPYSFEDEPRVGDQIVFLDMIHYTLVKTTMFNGVRHPDIAISTKDQDLHVLRSFDYEDYRSLMG